MGTYPDGESEEGELGVTSLHELGIYTYDYTVAEADGCWVEVCWDCNGLGKVSSSFQRNRFQEILNVWPALDTVSIEEP